MQGEPQKRSGAAHGPQNRDTLSHVEHGAELTRNAPFPLIAEKTRDPQLSSPLFPLSGGE